MSNLVRVLLSLRETSVFIEISLTTSSIFPRRVCLRAQVLMSSSYSKNYQAMSFFCNIIFTYFYLYFIIAQMFYGNHLKMRFD